MTAITVRVPASSANVGPGYDAFGLALGLHGRFSAELSEEWSVRVVGEGATTLPSDDTNPVVIAMRRVFAECGVTDCARIFCHSRIPIGRGLGSSAAAIVAGCLLADELCPVPLGRNELFGIAAEIEGHPDNVAAALFGGFTISWRDDVGLRCTRLDPPGLAGIVLPSAGSQSTAAARAALPDSVSHADAAFNSARAALMSAGIALGRPDLVRAGSSDRLHEPYRASLPRTFSEVRAVLLDAGADGVVVSGSGPSLLGVIVDISDRTAMHRANLAAKRAAHALSSVPGWGAPLALGVDRDGAVVEER